MTYMFRWLILAAVFGVISWTSEVHAQNKQWVSQFDGKTMNGWEKVGNP